jgi:hypothetical protein
MSPLLHLPVGAERQWADDERCRCGHARSDHDDCWTTHAGEAVRVPGKGRCDAPDCPCRRFRFASWIFHEDANQEAS